MLKSRDLIVRGRSDSTLFDDAEDEKTQILKILRQGKFYQELTYNLKYSKATNLLVYLKVASTIGCFKKKF